MANSEGISNNAVKSQWSLFGSMMSQNHPNSQASPPSAYSCVNERLRSELWLCLTTANVETTHSSVSVN